MKKIISIIAVMALLCTCMPMMAMAETTITPFDDDYTIAYSETFTYDDGTVLSSATFPDSKYVPSVEIKDQKMIYRQSEANKKGMMYFKFGNALTADQYTFGYNIKFENVTEIAPNDNNARTILTVAPGTFSYNSSDPNRSTCWRFYSKNNTGFIATLTEDIDENNNKKIKVGNASIVQGTEYSVWCNVDTVSYTYEYYLSDDAGNTQLIVSGNLNPYFDDIAQLSFTLESIVNHETTITVDDFYVKYESAKIMNICEYTAVEDDGTIYLEAFIPESKKNAKVYINDKYVCDIQKTEGKTLYGIKVDLPDGISLGDTNIEIKTTQNEKNYSTTVKTILAKKSLVKELMTAETAFCEKSVAVTPNYTEGIYQMSFDFKATDFFRLGVRFRNDSNGTAGSGTLFDSNTSAWSYWNYSAFSDCDIDLGGENYNHLDFIIDFTGEHGDGIKRPYWIYVNGKYAYSGTHTLLSNFTEDGFNYACINNSTNSGGSTRNGTTKNLILYRYDEGFTASDIIATYESGKTSSEMPFHSVGLKSIETNLVGTLGNVTEDNIYFADADGVKVENTSVSVSNNVAKINFTGDDILPGGEYKLVIGKDATFNGATLGANDEVDIELVSGDIIVSPVNSSIVSKNTQLSAYVADADKVLFYVNESLVKEFTEKTDNNVYTYDVTFAEDGNKTFDVYAYKNETVELLSSSFKVNSETFKYNVMSTPYKYLTQQSDGSYKVEDNTYMMDSTYGSVLHTGRVCYEATVTLPTTNSFMWLELGGHTSNIAATENGFATFSDALGYMTYDGNYNLFNSDGTIYRNGRKYSANTPYRIKFVIDFDKQQTEYYVDDILEGTKAFGNTLKSCDYLFYKIRHKGNISSHTLGDNATYDDTTKYITYKDMVVYSEAEMPEISDIKTGDASLKTDMGYIANEGTNSVDVYLTKAYSDITAELLEVKINDVEKTPTVSYDASNAKITISGLSLKAGDKVEVKISPDATITLKDYYVSDETTTYTVSGTEKTAKVIKANEANTEQVGLALYDMVYTSDNNGLVVLPLKSNKSGNTVTAFAKYINGGEEKQGSMLLGTWAAANRYSSVDFKGVTFEANKSGLVSISGEVGAKWNANLWDASYAPIAESIGE